MFYLEAADLVQRDVRVIQTQLQRLVHSLQAVIAPEPADGAPTASTLGNVPVALLDVRTISGEDNTSGIGVVVLPLDAFARYRLQSITDLAKDCCSKHDTAQSIRFKLGSLAPLAYSGALVRAIADVEDADKRDAQGLECCLGDQLCVEGYQVYSALPVNLADFERHRFVEAEFWDVTAIPGTVEFTLSASKTASRVLTTA